MVYALGYCHQIFNPAEPGRLCRGRERWIESWPRDTTAALFRAVISGASFSDDSARDANRGLPYSHLSLGEVLAAVLGDRKLVAYAEEAPPPLVPEDARGVEFFEHHDMGGPLRRWAARWSLEVSGVDEINAAVAAGADVFIVAENLDSLDDPPPPHDPVAPAADARPEQLEPLLPESLLTTLFFLTGFRNQGHPTRRFQPAAIARILEQVPLVALVHRDKHGPCTAIYSMESLEDLLEPLEPLARSVGALPVPFAIPPMLARWDRALWELRQGWDEATQGEFPVPPSRDQGGSWSRDRRRRTREE